MWTAEWDRDVLPAALEDAVTAGATGQLPAVGLQQPAQLSEPHCVRSLGDPLP